MSPIKSLCIHVLTLILCPIVSQAELETTIQSIDAQHRDLRLDRIPAVQLSAGSPVSAFVPAGAFASEWQGSLILSQRQRLIFSFGGKGSASLTINGEEILKEEGSLGSARSARIRLNPGEHQIRVSYRSESDGSGQFRLYWEELSFPRQTIPASAFSCQPSAELTASEQSRRGRELFALQHCGKCHQSEDGLGTQPMPEMQELAPLLMAEGDRVTQEWLRSWLLNPQAMRPGTTMPTLLDPADPDSMQKSADLAAYVATFSISAPPPAEASADEAAVLAGGAHFHRLGCVGCHSLPTATTNEEGRIPLRYVAKKFRPGALKEYLRDPQAYAPHRGMPNFRLNDEEIRTLSAYLRKNAEATLPFPQGGEINGDAQRGAALAASLNCGQCHPGLPTATKPAPSLQHIFRQDWSSKGCVSEAKVPQHPQVVLTAEKRAALLQFNKSNPAQNQLSLRNADTSEAATRLFRSLNCNACHSRDRTAAGLDTLHAESQSLINHITGAHATLDQSRPHLSFIGEMLKTPYMADVIAGKSTNKNRPWLEMRMPSYPMQASLMATGFAQQHGVNPQEQEAFTIDSELAKIGEQLTQSQQGFACNTCHAIGAKQPTAAFEVQGLNLNLAKTRLRYEWFMRWMDNPSSVTTGSKMPKYSDQGKSPNAAFDHDATQQFHALWHYLQSIPNPN